MPCSFVVRTVGGHSLVLFLQALWTSQIPVPLFLFSIQLKNLKFMLFQAPVLSLLKESKFKYNTLFELKRQGTESGVQKGCKP